jgi:hypothetical protein
VGESLRNPPRRGRRRISSTLLSTARPVDTHLNIVQVAFTHRCFPSEMAKSTGRTLVRSLRLRFRPHQQRLVRNYAGRNNVRPPKKRQIDCTPSFQVLVFDAVRRRISAVSASRTRSKFDKLAPSLVSTVSYVGILGTRQTPY